MNLVGKFFNEAQKITIEFKADGSYTLSGLQGYNTLYGGFRIHNNVKYAGYPYEIEFRHSTKDEDILSSGIYKAPVTFNSNDSFTTLFTDFCKEDFFGVRHPAIFLRVS